MSILSHSSPSHLPRKHDRSAVGRVQSRRLMSRSQLAHLRRLPRNPDPDAGDATPPRTPHCILEQQTSLSAAHAELELAARGNATVRPIPLLLQSPSVDDSPVGSAEMHRKQRLKRQEWKRRVQTALEGLCQAISLLGEVSGDPGMPNWVGVASKGASMIIKMVKVSLWAHSRAHLLNALLLVQQTKANIRDVATLLERIEALTQRINRWCSPQTTVPPSIRDHVSRLLRSAGTCYMRIYAPESSRCGTEHGAASAKTQLSYGYKADASGSPDGLWMPTRSRG